MRLRKISPLLLSENRKHFIENVNTYQPHEVSLQYSCYAKLPFGIFFRPQKGAKLIMITILKYLEPPIVVEQF